MRGPDVPSASPPQVADSGVASAPDASTADDGAPPLSPVLDDPRLGAARERSLAHDDAAAAAEVARVLAESPPADERACAWWYLLGRLYLSASDAASAANSFDRAVGGKRDGGPPCSLGPYAHVRRAQALLRTGDYDGAAAAAQAAGLDFAARDEAQLALAEAFAAKGDRAGSVPIWRDWLTVAGHGPAPGRPATPRWVDVSLRLADALLDGVDGPARERAGEALEASTRVLVESPPSAEKTDVLALRTRAAAAAGKPAPSLTPAERAAQARAWLDASKPERARETAEALLKAIPPRDKSAHAAACAAAIVEAQATPRTRSEAPLDAWGRAIARCEGEDELVTALYGGAKASAAAKRYPEALARFERVEQSFPRHRLADDARLRAAVATADAGDAVRSEAMLASIVDAYPDGDMRGEALVRVGLARIVARDYASAATTLDRAIEVARDDRAQGAGGRAAYFRARVADLSGAFDDAKDRYATLVAAEPLSYYMLLAYARLRALDEGRARAAREAAEAREAPGPLVASEHAELQSPAIDRFRRLLEVGEVDAARRELGAAGVFGDGVDPEVLWAVASLYDRAGVFDASHALSRGRLVDYRSHWPVGRWRRAWEIAFPRVWEPLVGRESAANEVEAPLVWGIMREESAFNPDAKSAANAFGLMQLIAPTARLAARGTSIVVDEDALKRPEVSIALGARVLSSLRRSFPGPSGLAIAAYNAGPRAVRRWLAERPAEDLDVFVDRIPFDETRAYVKRVLASEAAYAYLYAPDALDDLLRLPAAGGGPAPR